LLVAAASMALEAAGLLSSEAVREPDTHSIRRIGRMTVTTSNALTTVAARMPERWSTSEIDLYEQDLAQHFGTAEAIAVASDQSGRWSLHSRFDSARFPGCGARPGRLAVTLRPRR
jgi:hypothetical protein